MIKQNSFITIQSFMRTELNLTGNDLLVYAVIFGFSQDGKSKFTEYASFLMDWTGASQPTVRRSLKTLCKKGLIKKFNRVENKVLFCDYQIDLTKIKNA